MFPHPATRVRHLLTHSACLVGYEWLDARVTMREERTNASHLALVARDAVAPMFMPNSKFASDNVAYDVAAMVVERSTGATYSGHHKGFFCFGMRMTHGASRSPGSRTMASLPGCSLHCRVP